MIEGYSVRYSGRYSVRVFQPDAGTLAYRPIEVRNAHLRPMVPSHIHGHFYGKGREGVCKWLFKQAAKGAF
jgi:hypothetical protein